ncbi:MAG TPA: response regulator [Gaiellaceae bacterium]|nr:response regulator [Gaiellaceae bacterium]
MTDPAAPRPLSLLLIEDSETDAELVVLELRRHGFRVESGRVDAEAELREALRAGSWDLVLCDHNLPSFDSTAALRTLQDAGADVPFVVFSGTIGEEAAVEMLKAGARDVVLKTNLARLGPVVERVLEEAAERRRRSEAEEERARLEEMLRQSQKMEAIGSLAGGIAHDFNNVLLVVRGTCAQLLAELGDEAQRARVEEIDRAAESAADLTRQLLAFGRRQVLRPEPTDVSAVVRDTLELVGRLLGDDVELESALAPGLDNVLVDRSQLRQVVVNLVVNARDALADERRILIETANASLDESYAREHPEVVPGRYVVLKVTDSGVGMDRETQARIFDPFFTTKETGTGLGLATVYGIVKQSNGHIWVYSEPGRGSTFKVYLPSSDAAAPPPAEAPEVESPEGTETILVVEDSEMVRRLVTDTLRSYGYTVLAAGNGQEALEAAANAPGPIDLLLTDVVMPGLDGGELAERLAADRPQLRVLFSSGYPSDMLARHGIAEARVEFIEKPYLPEELGRKIRRVLDSAPQ